MGKPRPRCVYFLSFQSQILQKTVGISEIRTQIVRVEGEHADHLTTTTAQSKKYLHVKTPISNLTFITHANIDNLAANRSLCFS